MQTTRTHPADGLAWITGASSGIGRAVALELARRGWRVAATARRADELDKLAAEAAAQGLTILPCPGDVTDRAGLAQVVANIEAKGTPIALAMLNVGTFFPDDSGEWAGDAFRETFDVNLFGTLNALEPLLPRMIGRSRGQVAIVSSVAGYVGLPRAAAYGSSKAALISMCESLRFGLEPLGVGVQVICPGFVHTPLTAKNDFPMPFVIEADDAARRICDGLASVQFEVAFPRRMVWLLKTLRLLPYSLFFRLVGKGTGRG
jgi:short-subunit dehydrogenase